MEKVEIPNHPATVSGWEPYETYMKAFILEKSQEFAMLLVDFPPEISEDNRLHTHPISDRRITVIRGSGEFICYRDGRVQTFQLDSGDRVWMPRGVLHTFRSGADGLLVESVHSPFVPFDDRLCLLYPKKEKVI